MQRIQVVNCHAANEALENYVISGLPEQQLEEHLLVCSACREALIETEAYVEAIQSAARKLRRRETPQRSWTWRIATAPRLMWATAFVMVILVMSVGYPWRGTNAARLEPLAVMLQTSRGSDIARAPAGRPLLLLVDLTELPELSTY